MDVRANPWRRRAGMAGLIVVIIVLGYMMNISYSHASYVQSEFKARGARDNSRKAYYAAMAGVHFVISRLRQDPTSTFTNPANRLYFTSTVNSNNHYCSWVTGNVGSYTPADITGEVPNDTYQCYNTFTTNTDTNPGEYRFILCTYPGVASTSDYLIKSQGTYQELGSANLYRSQVWARLAIDVGSKFVAIAASRTMAVQALTPDNGGSEPDDFWDWITYD